MRRGFTLIELTISLALTLAAVALVSQLLIAASQEARRQQQRALALQAASNKVEELLAAPAADVAPSPATNWPLPEAVAAVLPGAQGTLEVVDVSPADARLRSRRITVRIDYNGSSAGTAQTVQLVGFRHLALTVAP